MDPKERLIYLHSVVLFLAGVLIVLYASGCSTPQVTPTQDSQQMNPDTAYRMDLELEVNGLKGQGLLVVPRAVSYSIRAKAPTNPEIVTASTCHREQVLGKQDDKFRVEYVPNELESKGYCPLTITAFAPKFSYAGGLVIPSDPSLRLQGVILCNGNTVSFAGVGACQSRAGLPQEIRFDSDVRWVGDPACPPLKEIQPGRAFEVRLAPRQCLYTFKEKGLMERFARILAYGYAEFRTPKGN